MVKQQRWMNFDKFEAHMN